jgi:hypothetical protein
MQTTKPCSRRAPARRQYLAVGAALALAAGAGACRPGGGGGGGGSGTGPGGGAYEVDARLANHTIYHPADLAAVTRPMPLVVWGNGACAGDGAAFKTFLSPLAGKGVLAIANGAPGGTAATSADQLKQSIDWAVAENTRAGSKYQGKIDTTKVSAMGQSCGGIQAITVAADPRVGSTILWNSGLFANGTLGATKDALTKLHGPTAWLDGGPSDIAYQNSVDDYAKVPNSVPAVHGSYGNVGHVGLWYSGDARNAEMATVAKYWVDASLYGDAAAKAQFVGANCGLCTGTQWKMESKNW